MREIQEKGLFWHWGIRMYRLRWAVTIFWILLFIVSAYFVQKLPDRLKESGFNSKGSESDLGFSLMKKELGTSPSTVTIVYTSHDTDLTSEQAKKDILHSLDKLKKRNYVEKIHINSTTRLIEDKGIQSVVVELKLKNQEALNHFPEMKRLIGKPQGMDTYVDGEIATTHEVQQATKQDMAHSEKIGLPIALLVLLFIFGTVWAAIPPLLVGIMSVSLALGKIYYLTDYYSFSNFLPNIVMMLGLAIGVDYALFLVSRFREELKRQESVKEAVAMATQTTEGKGKCH
ncbi:MMPL family transporter [Bacillus sp. ISL-40]|uniref:MMPL family transporter n=1 Tax=unclassified Bacillus (in: firmicutes) TaxID=185979 RepID=UPI001BE72A19|nr:MULTISPECIES: MMPL family transporter [unclassified Bacillus (in: firmicutes)]MBT2700315.1 MMPL family transporter [Bacillus sp. ISL-40]MBT2742833.1 MMPL family transporter [Bacillus sp. ISL-77]